MDIWLLDVAINSFNSKSFSPFNLQQPTKALTTNLFYIKIIH